MKAVSLIFSLVLAGQPLLAQPVQDQMATSEVIYVGETHDNPVHHQRQADYVARYKPRALVFEMLTPDQAQKAVASVRGDQAALEAALGWADTGWPDFAMYYPIFAAAPNAAIYGAAVPREATREAMKSGISDWFGPEAEAYGLTTPLSEEQQEQREALQQEVHCNALPDEMLPVMVDVQRLRDAVIARAVLQAVDETGGPVMVITGNGHARKDWGAPAVVAHVRPEVSQFVVGQTEDDETADPSYDITLSAPAAPREDPCKAFR